MIDMIIFSKNRACQLDLLLRTAEHYFKSMGRVFILYIATNKEYEQGYTKLNYRYKDKKYSFIPESNFKSNLLDLLNYSNTEYILGNSDDNVFIDKCNLKRYVMPFHVVAFSMRLGKGFNFCLPANLPMIEPDYISDDGKIIKWEWTILDSRTCWGYPHPVDSNIYRRKWWIDFIKDANFKNPCSLEVFMNDNRQYDKPFLQSFVEPKLISISANETGQGANNVHGGQSLKELNDRWLHGEIIDEKDFYNITVTQCHIIKKYNFKKG